MQVMENHTLEEIHFFDFLIFIKLKKKSPLHGDRKQNITPLQMAEAQ